MSAFETCARKHYHEDIAKTVRRIGSAAADYGTEVHAFFEKRLKNDAPLPLDLRHHEKVMARLATAPGTLMTEQRLALTSALAPTGYFDSDVWVRGRADFVKVNGTRALVIDYKTGRLSDSFDQLDLMSAMVFATLPEIATMTSAFYWTKEKQFMSKAYSRSDSTRIWSGFLPRAARRHQAIIASDWPARPNFLCRRYCPVTSCQHNGH